MQMVRNTAILLILLPLVVVLFMPKRELYYLLEKKLYEKNIVISGEKLDEEFLGLTVEHPIFYLNGAAVASARKISLWSILFYTKVDFHDLKIAEGLPMALDIGVLDTSHSVLSPLQATFSGESSLGKIDGEVQLQTRIIHLNISEGGKKRAFAKYLKKSEKGWVYESKF